MKARLIFLSLLCGMQSLVWGQLPTNNPDSVKILLPNGWSLTPAGRHLPLGDLPLNMQLSPSTKLLAITNNGQGNQSIQLVNTQTEQITCDQPINTAWYGLKFGNNGNTLFVSGGNDNYILAYPVVGEKLGSADTIILGEPWPKEKISPTGIEIDDSNKRLYTVTKEDNSLYIVDLKSKKVTNKIDLEHEAYSCILSPDKKELYISLWGGDAVAVYDTQLGKIVTTLKTENHPNEMVLTKNGRYLFVANANSNSVSLFDIPNRKLLEVMSTSLFSTKLTGSTTNGLALSGDEKTLYIANADNNCLAVFDVSDIGKSKSKGFIPTGWYPTNVKVVDKKIFVSNGKGYSSLPNPEGPQPTVFDDSQRHQGNSRDRGVQYIGALFKGTLSIISEPKVEQLKLYTKQVYSNTPYSKEKELKANGVSGNPIPQTLGQPSPIKYVFYIIKENRTYDQVLGDMPEGNGDASLCIFPEQVTPNQHAISREYVLLDNFYVDAEVSADGHNWSTAAYATDYVEKTWPISYGKRGGTYDYEGSRKIAYPKDGFIWDYCQRAGVTYRSYGEFADFGTPNIKALEGKIAPKYASFNMDIKDVDRIIAWKNDFDSLLSINSVPQFNSIRLGNDHTSGQRIGKPTPKASVADNDLALGQFIEYLSHSPIWKESAIFVLEDDAQNGPDHIDAHRSIAFVISPYVKRKAINSNMYSTSGMLRTMELILGLPPMSQYDAAAMPLFECFTSEPDFTPYTAKAANIDLNELNVARNESAQRSEAWNFTKEDSAPDIDLNEVVWKSIKGEDSTMPAPRRSAFVQLELKKKKEND